MRSPRPFGPRDDIRPLPESQDENSCTLFQSGFRILRETSQYNEKELYRRQYVPDDVEGISLLSKQR